MKKVDTNDMPYIIRALNCFAEIAKIEKEEIIPWKREQRIKEAKERWGVE